VIIDKIFEHAREQPEKLAIAYGPRKISYREFASWILQAREFLVEQDLRRGSVAVLAVECMVDCWVLTLALQSLGLTTIAVGVAERVNELQLRNIGCIITADRGRLLKIAPAAKGLKRIQIPEYFYLHKPTQELRELPVMTPGDGHIVLTSGTTGIRKKVLVDSKNLADWLRRRSTIYGISENSIVNIFNFGMWTGIGYKVPLATWHDGGSVVMHQFTDVQPALLIDGITIAVFTPPLLERFLQAKDIKRSETMRLIVGGAAVPRAMIAAAQARITPHVFVGIGSREAGMWALTLIERDEDSDSHIIEPSVEVQIVDDHDRPLPAGQTGLVRLRSPEMVASYLDDEEASRAVFRHGYFYPGDLGTLRPDGRLVLNGRANNVLNVRGRKIAAEQIELALQESLAVNGVCVLPVRNDGGDEEFDVVIESEKPIDKTKLASSISAQLPGIPYARVQFVRALPRNDTGKIDRAALRQQLLAERATPSL